MSAASSGGVRGAIETELGESLAGREYFLHGTTAEAASSFELELGRPFFGTTDPSTARLFGLRTIAKAGGGELGGVALVLDRQLVLRLRSEGMLVYRGISDMPGKFEWVFGPEASEFLKKFGEIVPLPPGLF